RALLDRSAERPGPVVSGDRSGGNRRPRRVRRPSGTAPRTAHQRAADPERAGTGPLPRPAGGGASGAIASWRDRDRSRAPREPARAGASVARTTARPDAGSRAPRSRRGRGSCAGSAGWPMTELLTRPESDLEVAAIAGGAEAAAASRGTDRFDLVVVGGGIV